MLTWHTPICTPWQLSGVQIIRALQGAGGRQQKPSGKQSLQPNTKFFSDIQIKNHIHRTNKSYTCSKLGFVWRIIHLQPFRRPQTPGEMLELGVILSETTHKVWQWTSDGEGPFISPASDQNPTRGSF